MGVQYTQKLTLMKPSKFRKFLLPIVLLFFMPAISAQKKYPYTDFSDDNGPIIVSRDKQGGVHPDAISGDDVNRIARAFQVDIADKGSMNYTNAKAACVDGWRLPNKRELQLIWIMGGAQSDKYRGNYPAALDPLFLYNKGGYAPMAPSDYWSATDNWHVYFTDGKAISGYGPHNVRCIRDYDVDYGEGIPYTGAMESSIIYMAPYDVDDGVRMQWYNIKQGITCAYPYYVPDKNRLIFTWVYRDAFTDNQMITTGPYWAATEDLEDSDNAWRVNQIGLTGTFLKEYTIPIRCIRENKKLTNRYPHIIDNVDGPIIVSREGSSGINSAALRKGGGTSATDNKVSPKLQIANSDIGRYEWSEALTICPNEWRLPTQRELQLIWLLGGSTEEVYTTLVNEHLADETPLYDKSKFPNFNASDIAYIYYWSATRYDEDRLFYVNFKGSNTGGHAETQRHMVRCVRDVD